MVKPSGLRWVEKPRALCEILLMIAVGEAGGQALKELAPFQGVP